MLGATTLATLAGSGALSGNLPTIGSQIGGALGNLGQVFGVGAMLSGANGLANSMLGAVSSSAQYKYAKKLMKRQFVYNQRYAKEGPSWQVEGLRAAGLNPILAAGTTSSYNASMPQAPAVDYGSIDMLSSAMALQQLKMAEKKNNAEVALLNAQKRDIVSATYSRQLDQDLLKGKLDYAKKDPLFFAPSKGLWSTILNMGASSGGLKILDRFLGASLAPQLELLDFFGVDANWLKRLKRRFGDDLKGVRYHDSIESLNK